MGRYAYVWEFRVGPERKAEFEAAYGPDGDWARLFRRAPGYLRTELLSDPERPGRYLTVDHWESRAACDAFRDRFRADFDELDARCEDLTESETKLGDFETVE